MTDSTPRRPTLQDAATYPLPGMAVPSALSFSHDDRWVGYLLSAAGALAQGLYVYDRATGTHHPLWSPGQDSPTEASLSPEERLRRERVRLLAVGLTDYAWIDQGQRLLVPLAGDLYCLDDLTAAPSLLLAGQGKPILDPQLSPDGTAVAYVQDAELHSVSLANGAVRQLTFGARERGLTHGLAEYIAQEEMRRFHGFWWSPDSDRLAFTEVDETHIPPYTIVHQGQEALGESLQEVHRYPFAGKDNARVRLGVVSACGGEPIWMDLGLEDGSYLARVAWSPDGALWAQLVARDQRTLRLLRLDPATGRAHCALVEHSPIWINLHDSLYFLRDGRFIWASERSGFMHLYLYGAPRIDAAPADGSQPLTQGDWMVDSLVGVDEERGRVYFLGNRETPTEKHLYVVTLEGGEPQRLTADAGTHAVVVDHALRSFVDTFSALDQPPTVRLSSLDDGQTLATLFEPLDPRLAALDLRPPEIIRFTTEEGVTLYGALYLPDPAVGPSPSPLIVSVYGGPHSQRVANAWTTTVDMRAQALSARGYVVLKVDNRGSARRGIAFEGAIKHNLGDVEVRDQCAGVRWLVAQGLVDPQRVGIYGWSYGGYMAAMCLARAPQTFRVAVAGAPVTHWDGYDTFYTERYMGTPASNPDGYQSSSVMAHVVAIEGHLLIVHGLIDENVHFRHSARLINALMRAGKPYDLLLLPDARHMPRNPEDRLYVEARIADYFDRFLG